MLGIVTRFIIRKFGLAERLTRVSTHSGFALQRIAGRGIEVGTVIDIGASNGAWSEDALRSFPHARYLLIEAQKIHKAALDRFVARHANASYVLKAAGAAPGGLYFKADAPLAGLAVETDGPGLIPVPATSVDAEIAARNLPGPYVIKFDVHGFEKPILRGAKNALTKASLIVMECYNFQITPDALMLSDMCKYFEEMGFRVADISEPLWRPGDRMFWQIDIFFLRGDRPEFSSNTYD